MHRALALLDLAVMLAGATGSIVGRSRYWGWPLLIASGVWLPLNNGILEGPVLYALNGDHGLTVADVLGITGVIAGGLRLWPPWPGRSRRWLAVRAGVVIVVIVAGLVTAVLYTDERVADRLRLRDEAPQVTAERALPSRQMLRTRAQVAALLSRDGVRRPIGARART